MASKTVAAVLATATWTGLGGYLFGVAHRERDDRFLVNAQLKDVLAGTTTDTSCLPAALSTSASEKPATASVLRDPLTSANTNSAATSTLNNGVGQNRFSQIVIHGLPTSDYIRSRSDYVLAYDR